MYRKCLIVILLISYFERNNGSSEEENTVGHPIVYTNQGIVRGNTYATLNTTVDVFWSIPFAEPPIGPLRFQHPVRKSNWSEILDGTRRPNACYQAVKETWALNVPESEDCLYLNVFLPNTSSSSDGCDDVNVAGRHLLPVMFYIYGGGFDSGSSSIDRYNASALAALNDVIVVTFNYRLGAFGFLYSASEEAPGNAALYDQVAALQWVHDNIRCFGGNPNDVTVFGNSAGGFSTAYLIQSKLTHGLFHKAILMSGAPMDQRQLATLQTYEPLIKVLGHATNCTDGPSLPEVTACLKLLSAEDMNLAQKSHRRAIRIYWPVMDVEFFGTSNSSSMDVFAEIATKNLSVVVGVVQNEGAYFIARRLGNNGSFSNSFLHSTIDIFSNLELSKYLVNVQQKLATHYLYTNWDDVDDRYANRQMLCDYLSDFLFVCPSNEFANKLTEYGADVYYYVFNERPSISVLPDWAGVTHADELHFVFGHPLDPNQGYKSEEAETSRRIIQIFGNFAKYGVPSYDGFDSWPRYTGNRKLYVELNANGQHAIKTGPRASHCGFWNNLLHKLGEEGCSSEE